MPPTHSQGQNAPGRGNAVAPARGACHTHPTITFHPTDMTHDLPATLPRSLPPCSLIGAPTDIGAGARGASMGPEALRVAGLQAALELHGLQVLDRGNLSGPSNP